MGRQKFHVARHVISWCLLAVAIEGYKVTFFRRSSHQEPGNTCPESTPWPCKSPDHCLSFDFICDGETDCPDEYDEDPNLCTAKDRPALGILEGFIERFHGWLTPTYLGEGSSRELALRLIESKTLESYEKSAKLTEEQRKNFRELMDAIKNGQQIRLMLMGMPPEAWNELYALFKRIIDTGFLGH